jgi:hypothetical protein
MMLSSASGYGRLPMSAAGLAAGVLHILLSREGFEINQKKLCRMDREGRLTAATITPAGLLKNGDRVTTRKDHI